MSAGNQNQCHCFVTSNFNALSCFLLIIDEVVSPIEVIVVGKVYVVGVKLQ